MTISPRRSFTLLFMPLLACSLLLAGCALRPDRNLRSSNLYDLGPLPQAKVTLPAVHVSIAEISAPAWLDSTAMFYRLDYANSQQPHPYAQSRWLSAPAQMFGQRLKARIAAAGGIAANASDAASNLSMLRIDANDFIHAFDAPEKSHGDVSMRVSVYSGRVLIAQKSFTKSANAPSNNADGGAKALATASDAVIDEIIPWLATLPLKR